jgi:hypothetical protein
MDVGKVIEKNNRRIEKAKEQILAGSKYQDVLQSGIKELEEQNKKLEEKK